MGNTALQSPEAFPPELVHCVLAQGMTGPLSSRWTWRDLISATAVCRDLRQKMRLYTGPIYARYPTSLLVGDPPKPRPINRLPVLFLCDYLHCVFPKSKHAYVVLCGSAPTQDMARVFEIMDDAHCFVGSPVRVVLDIPALFVTDYYKKNVPDMFLRPYLAINRARIIDFYVDKLQAEFQNAPRIIFNGHTECLLHQSLTDFTSFFATQNTLMPPQYVTTSTAFLNRVYDSRPRFNSLLVSDLHW